MDNGETLKLILVWKPLLTKAAIICAASMITSWAIITATARFFGKDLPIKVKTVIPVVISVVIAYFAYEAVAWLRVVFGFVIGTITTSIYDWGMSHLFELIEIAAAKIKERVINFFSSKPPAPPVPGVQP